MPHRRHSNRPERFALAPDLSTAPGPHAIAFREVDR
jgi:hypothetical protein